MGLAPSGFATVIADVFFAAVGEAAPTYSSPVLAHRVISLLRIIWSLLEAQRTLVGGGPDTSVVNDAQRTLPILNQRKLFGSQFVSRTRRPLSDW
jgi:hypothetical protein